jgi:hypothetical protein
VLLVAFAARLAHEEARGETLYRAGVGILGLVVAQGSLHRGDQPTRSAVNHVCLADLMCHETRRWCSVCVCASVSGTTEGFVFHTRDAQGFVTFTWNQ